MRMATVADQGIVERPKRPDILSGTPRAHSIDRWIYVFTAASFVVIVLAGFIPSSMAKIAAVQAGERPPFPLLMHMHALLMGSFLLLLLAQKTLVAVGRCDLHRRLGLLSMVIAPALVVVGFLLIRLNFDSLWNALQAAPPGAARDKLETGLEITNNIKLLQMRIGIVFPLFLVIALRARGKDAGLHKRMMILATAMTLPAGIDRIPWLPATFPDSALSADFYTLLAISPMFVWDVVRNKSVHRAYWIWLGVNIPFAIAVHGLWGTEAWQRFVPAMMGV
jgi:hypothetical protein